MRKVEQRRRERRIRYAGVGALIAAAVVAGAVWIPAATQDDEPATSPLAADGSGSVTPLPMTGPVRPGRYEARFSGGGSATPRAVLEVPEGFESFDGSAVLEPDGAHGVGLWTTATVRKDPCDRSETGHDPGPLVSDFAAALQSQLATRATRPVPITLGGYDGLFLELTTPERGAAGACPTNRYDLWTTSAGGPRYVGPGAVLSLWILDAGGDRLVVDAVGSDDGSDVGRQVAEMVRSVRVVDPEGDEPSSG